MKKYTVREVCALLGVKPHVIRYWEQEIPFLSPAKTLSGRRIFQDRDLQILFRLRHLLYDKKYTIEGARTRILEELDAGDPDMASSIRQIRTELMSVLRLLRDKNDLSEPD